MEGEVKNLFNVWLSVVASLCYCYCISSKIPKGKYRLFSLLPIFYLFSILPLYLSSAFLIAIIAFFITWLANFKLLLFSFDLGPLSNSDPPKSLSLLLFITAASLPFRIKPNTDHDLYPSSQSPHSPDQNLEYKQSSKPTKKLPLNPVSEAVILALLMSVSYDYKEHIHPKVLLLLYCCLVFLMIDVLIASSNAMVRALVGLELGPPSDEPYLSTSLQDFWGRRWNLMVTNILRHTVYKPARSAWAAILGSEWAALPAVLVTFIVSGLMHELIFYYITRAAPTWEMTSFFVLHGVCVVVEMGVKRALIERWRLPWFVSWPLTVGFMVVSSFWLFFPPLLRNGVDVRVLEEFKPFVEFIKIKLKLPI